MSQEKDKNLTIVFGVLVAAGFLVVAALISVWVYYYIDPRRSDQQMMERFYQHQDDYNRLVEMFNQDSGLSRIANDFLSPKSAEESFSPDRWNEYRRLFKKSEAKNGVTRHEDGSISITIFSSGALDVGTYDGYMYSTTTPEHLVDSISRSRGEAKSGERIYRHITGNWYQYYTIFR